jgi:alkanesulfonate monooxygenase SsuD/methylene tetrahydromethanopterin reductase-like flavin-dependent oxidoreductase (luciferase family)
MLDQMSRGRFLLGIGKASRRSRSATTASTTRTPTRCFAESFAIIMQALTTKTVDFEGEFFRYKNVPFEVAAVPEAASAAVVRRGQSGQRRARGQGRDELHQQFDRRAGEGQGRALHAATTSQAGHPAPKFGMNRYMVLAETEEKALRSAGAPTGAGGRASWRSGSSTTFRRPT